MYKAQVCWWGLLETSHLFWNLFLLGVLSNHLQGCLGAIKYLKSNVWQISEHRMQVDVPWGFYKLLIPMPAASANKKNRRAADSWVCYISWLRNTVQPPAWTAWLSSSCSHSRFVCGTGSFCWVSSLLCPCRVSHGDCTSFKSLMKQCSGLLLRVLWHWCTYKFFKFLNQDDTWCKRVLRLLQHLDLE